MKILLVNVDSVIPNVALQKLRFYHEQQGDRVSQIKDESLLPFIDAYNKIYVSCVFDYHKYRCRKWRGIAEIGGSGYSLKKCLPAKIEEVKPKKNIGFATRGCIRNCPWCIVQQKEGKMRVVGDVYDIWDGKTREIMLLDNNILALPEQFFKVCSQLKKEKLIADFNQGLDHRLLTDKMCEVLFSLQFASNRRMTFAFDHMKYEKSVSKALKMLQKHGLKDWQTMWYIYVGTYDTKETVLKRINIIRDLKQLVFVMQDRAVRSNSEFKKIYQWTCHIPLYATESYPPKQLLKEDTQPNLF
jgi:hypothetical protein